MTSLFEHHRRICSKCNFEAFGRMQSEREFLLPNKRGVNLRWASTCRKCRAMSKLDKIRVEIEKIDAARERLHEQRRQDKEAGQAMAGGTL